MYILTMNKNNDNGYVGNLLTKNTVIVNSYWLNRRIVGKPRARFK